MIFFPLADCPVMAYCFAMMMSVGALEEIYDYARFDVRPFLKILCGRKSGSNACKLLLVFKILWTILGIVCVWAALLAGAAEEEPWSRGGLLLC